MKSLVKVAAFILVFSGIIVLLHSAIGFISHKDPGLLMHHGWGQLTFYLLFVLNVFLFQQYVNKESFVFLGLELYPGWLVTVLKGWIAGAIAFVFYSWLMSVFGVLEFSASLKIGKIVVAVLVAFSAFTIAFTEEVLFRGFFLQTMLKELPKWVAVTVTGIIFIFFHDLANIQNFWTVPRSMMLAGGLFSLNVLLCVAYLKSKTLYLPIGIHSGLVFAKIVFKQGKLMGILQRDSYLFGLDGDARRGVLAWLLFLGGILVLNFLITEREKKGLASKKYPWNSEPLDPGR